MESLLFFPQPLPDESLYSLAVRYHRLAANNSYRLTSQELFGTYSRTCGSILPCCLGALSQRLEEVYSVEELIERFTLLPLYRPFVNDAVYSAACIAMTGSYGTGLKMSLGITASRFLKHTSFRYCDSCVREDTLNYGAAYWHRIHQAIGTCICPHHREGLLAMTFPDGADWRRMLLPSEERGTPVMESLDGAAAAAVAEMQLWGLEHPRDVQVLLKGNFLRCRLDKMRFVKSGRLRERMLRAFLAPRLLCSARAAEFEEIAHSSDWVLRVLRPRGVVQPFKFYFLCWLLGLSLEQLKLFRPKATLYIGDRTGGHDAVKAAKEVCIEAHRSAFSSSGNLKCHEKPGYMWLYRHDREWLAQYVAAHPFVRLREASIDWKGRDSALAQELLIAKNKLLSAEGKPKKLTRAALCRLIANDHCFLKVPHHFPLSIALVDESLESIHDHQVRKIRWAVQRYALDERSAMSVVYRFAGIRVSQVPEIELQTLLLLWSAA
ncbi:TnsD family Tn7-like transposition protein [Pseudomonas brenneri]|jgi:hypothetical protein|uniref:TnsD family Tn7-like transposition protein n=1 Tax=Pseudomonas brenneri TaxID=129817 RepID=UPI003B9E3251